MNIITKSGELVESKSAYSKIKTPESKAEEEYNQSVEFEMKINSLCKEKKLSLFFKKIFK